MAAVVLAANCPPASSAPRILREAMPPPRQPRLLDSVRHTVRARHHSRRTEKAFVAWTRRYILFHGKRHPSGMGAAELTQYVTFGRGRSWAFGR